MCVYISHVNISCFFFLHAVVIAITINFQDLCDPFKVLNSFHIYIYIFLLFLLSAVAYEHRTHLWCVCVWIMRDTIQILYSWQAHMVDMVIFACILLHGVSVFIPRARAFLHGLSTRRSGFVSFCFLAISRHWHHYSFWNHSVRMWMAVKIVGKTELISFCLVVLNHVDIVLLLFNFHINAVDSFSAEEQRLFLLLLRQNLCSR